MASRRVPLPRKAKTIAPAPSNNAPATVTSSVKCFAPYKKAVWEPIGRAQEGVEATSVQYSQGLRPPGHVTAFIRISSQASEGLTKAGASLGAFK